MRGFYYVKDECAVSNAKSRAIPVPSRGTAKAAGYDFYSPNDFVIEPGQTCMIWTDIKALFPEDEVLKIYPRSSMSVQRNLVLKNTVGIIDSDYYENKSNDGNIGIALWNVGNVSQSVKQGEKMAQGIFEKYYTTTDAGLISERQGGFGSTDI
jgi:dUTP pyrophosphatase